MLVASYFSHSGPSSFCSFCLLAGLDCVCSSASVSVGRLVPTILLSSMLFAVLRMELRTEAGRPDRRDPGRLFLPIRTQGPSRTAE